MIVIQIKQRRTRVADRDSAQCKTHDWGIQHDRRSNVVWLMLRLRGSMVPLHGADGELGDAIAEAARGGRAVQAIRCRENTLLPCGFPPRRVLTQKIKYIVIV